MTWGQLQTRQQNPALPHSTNTGLINAPNPQAPDKTTQEAGRHAAATQAEAAAPANAKTPAARPHSLKTLACCRLVPHQPLAASRSSASLLCCRLNLPCSRAGLVLCCDVPCCVTWHQRPFQPALVLHQHWPEHCCHVLCHAVLCHSAPLNIQASSLFATSQGGRPSELPCWPAAHSNGNTCGRMQNRMG